LYLLHNTVSFSPLQVKINHARVYECAFIIGSVFMAANTYSLYCLSVQTSKPFPRPYLFIHIIFRPSQSHQAVLLMSFYHVWLSLHLCNKASSWIFKILFGLEFAKYFRLFFIFSPQSVQVHEKSKLTVWNFFLRWRVIHPVCTARIETFKRPLNERQKCHLHWKVECI
jgi:hypothetical protein